MGDENEADGRMQWVEDRLKLSFTTTKADKLKKGLLTEENVNIFNDFFGTSDSRVALVTTDAIVG